jgi:putative hydrolase of the HAD superfamily
MDRDRGAKVDVIEIVFFDAGETLLRPHPSFSELFSTTARSHGVEISPDDVNRVQSVLAPHLIDLAEEDEDGEGLRYEGSSLSEEGSERFWMHLYRRLLKELGVEDEGLARRLFEVFSSSASYKLFDDVLPTLSEIEGAGYRMGLISNFERWLEEMLVELEVGHHFDPAIISGIEGVEKPDPAIYELALKKAGVEAQNAVHVGDSPDMDVRPAASLGIRGILIDRSGRYMQSEQMRVTSLEEIPPLLGNL